MIADIFLLGQRQNMRVMEAAWPLTILYWGPIGLLFYFLVRSQQVCGQGGKHAETPMWQASFNSAAHCGAGCALGDFNGTWIVFATGVTGAGAGGGPHVKVFDGATGARIRQGVQRRLARGSGRRATVPRHC